MATPQPQSGTVSPITSHPGAHPGMMMRMGSGPPPPGGGPYGPGPPLHSHSMPPPHHHMSGPPHGHGPGPGGPRSPPSSNGGSSGPSSMPNSPASAASSMSHGYHSGHSGHSGPHGMPPPSPYGPGGPMPPHARGGMMPPHTSPANSPRGMNTPSPPPAHQMGGPGSSGSTKVTPDAAARAAHAKATGEAPVGPPTWRRMPCKARSVPDGHTTETAYLTIPPNAQHGLVLACSHPECRQSGKRFRFCAVCDLPVAKRNFLKRHSHGLVSPARSPRTDDDDDGVHEEEPNEGEKASTSATNGQKKSGGNEDGNKDSSAKPNVARSNSESDVGASAPTSKGSAFAGSQYKRPREAGSTPPRDSDRNRESGNGGGAYPPYHGDNGINQAMSWPPHAADGRHPPAYHPGVDSDGRDAAGRLGLSPYDRQGYPLHGHPAGAYNSPPGPHHHQMHHIPPHGSFGPPGHHPGFSPQPSDYGAPRNAAGAFRGLPPNHSGGPSPRSDDFEPPQPEYSVMRLSRCEREWLQLYRARPNSSDREATNAWVNKCLSYSEPMTESHDETGGGVEAVLRDRSSSQATGLHSSSTVQAKTNPTVTPPSAPGSKSDGPANVSHDTSAEVPGSSAAADGLDLSPCPPRKNTGGSLSTLSMTGESVTDLLESAILMDGVLGDMPMVDDPHKGNLKMGGGSVSSGDVSPISNNGAGGDDDDAKGGSFRISPNDAPPMPSLNVNASYPNESVRDSLQRAKIEGERAAASGRNSVRPSSPRAGVDTPVNMESEPSWGCSFLPPLCGAFNM